MFLSRLSVLSQRLSASQFSHSMSNETFSAHFFVTQVAFSFDNFVNSKTRFNFYYNLQVMRDDRKTFTAPILSQKQVEKKAAASNIAVTSKKLFPRLPKI